MTRVQQVISMLSGLAPGELTCEWDNSGVQVGNLNRGVENILLTLDVTEQVLEEALQKKCGMVIAHHPLLFNPIKAVHNQSAIGNNIIKAIKNDIFIYAAHTNLDIAPGGLNDYLAKLLGVKETSPLQVEQEKKFKKIVTFVPEDHLKEVKEAIFTKGAGFIGNYSHTSFRTEGEGTFKPATDTQPFTGKKGKVNKVREMRLETIAPAGKVERVVKALVKAHPYEEVAYDIYPLDNREDVYGLGRIGKLSEKVRFSSYMDKISRVLDRDYIRYTGSLDKEIKKVAVCNGAGADLISRAAARGADLFVTGDIKYHEAQLSERLGVMLVEAGHYESEVMVIDLLYDYLLQQIVKENLEINLIKSEVNTNPWSVWKQ
ncbi:MAG: Nif3-like dinuclear metal center hexameric protein [Halanaerobiaceae bacterium]